MEFLPSKYIHARHHLINSVLMAPDVEEKKKQFDRFSQVFTVSSDFWAQRIALELPPHGTPITKDVKEVCLKLRRKAMKHFHGLQYLPDRIQELCEDEKVPKLVKVFQFRGIKLNEAFPVGSIKNMESFLTFPHSQLPHFYRYYQFSSGTPVPSDIKEKYDKALESYHRMITIAMKPYEWIEWMKLNFAEEDWTSNFECKLNEHYFMKEIWFAYIKFLDQRNNIEVLNVYKRYCRLFVDDSEMQKKYSIGIKRYQNDGNDVNPWKCDEIEFRGDFYPNRVFPNFSINIFGNLSIYMGFEVLKTCLPLPCLCRECFEVKNERHMRGKLNLDELRTAPYWKTKELLHECYLCGESLKEEDCNSERNDGGNDTEMPSETSLSIVESSKIKFHLSVKIQFHDSRDPSIPLSLFHYILENANHQVLSKLYATSKYFFFKQHILLCYRIRISSNTTEKYMEQALSTNVKAILKSPFKKYCCGATLSFRDSSNPNLLSKCLSKLCCCSLTNLVIVGQNLTVDEFKYLLSSGKLEYVDLEEVRIFKKNGKMMKIEEIIAMLPTVTDFSVNTKSRQMFTPRSSQRIAALFRDGKKFDSFILFHVPDTFNLESFKTFLRNHMQLRGYFGLGFRQNVNPHFRAEYRQLLKEVRDNWLPEYRGPQSGYTG